MAEDELSDSIMHLHGCLVGLHLSSSPQEGITTMGTQAASEDGKPFDIGK